MQYAVKEEIREREKYFPRLKSFSQLDLKLPKVSPLSPPKEEEEKEKSLNANQILHHIQQPNLRIVPLR